MDLNVLSLSGNLSQAARRCYLEEPCSRYNNTPDGKQLPAAYVNLSDDCNVNCPSATQLPDKSRLVRIDRQVKERKGKTVFLLFIMIKVDHIASSTWKEDATWCLRCPRKGWCASPAV
jgi:hypothetical protein